MQKILRKNNTQNKFNNGLVKTTHHDPVGFIPQIPVRLNTYKSMNVRQHPDKAKDRIHRIFSIKDGKIEHSFMIKMLKSVPKGIYILLQR